MSQVAISIPHTNKGNGVTDSMHCRTHCRKCSFLFPFCISADTHKSRQPLYKTQRLLHVQQWLLYEKHQLLFEIQRPLHKHQRLLHNIQQLLHKNQRLLHEPHRTDHAGLETYWLQQSRSVLPMTCEYGSGYACVRVPELNNLLPFACVKGLELSNCLLHVSRCLHYIVACLRVLRCLS